MKVHSRLLHLSIIQSGLPPNHSKLVRYSLALMFVLLATAGMLLLDRWIPMAQSPFLLLYVSVMASAWCGGLSSGILASVVALVCADYWFIPPLSAFGPPTIVEAARLSVFMVMSLLISTLSATRLGLVKALSQERDLIAAVVNTAGSLILVLEPSGKIVQFNHTCERITGYAAREVQGRYVWELFPAAEFNAVQQMLKQLQASILPSEYEGDWITKEGQSRRILWSNTVLYDDAGKVSYIVGTGLDRTEQQAALRDRSQAERALQETNQTLQALIQASPLSITLLDQEGRVKLWNPAAERIFGWKAEEAIGSIMPSVPRDKQTEFQENIAATLRGDFNNGAEVQRRRKDGSSVDISLWASVIAGETPAEDCVLSVVADVSDRKRAEAERERAEQTLRAQTAELAQANRLKDEFLAVLSHELRTPLNAILGWSQILCTRPLDSETSKRALDTIQRNARLQSQLIADILDVSKIIRGQLRLHLRPMTLAPVITAAIEATCPAASAKGICLDAHIDSVIGEIYGDPERLQQVVWNLLSNAIKFTPMEGQVTIELTSVESNRETRQPQDAQLDMASPPQPAYAQIRVSDTGRGIHPDFLPFVFDRFRQEESSTVRQVGGLGLGLAIVRHLVELHGGAVDVASGGVGQGATFTVRLPLIKTKLVLAGNDADSEPDTSSLNSIGSSPSAGELL